VKSHLLSLIDSYLKGGIQAGLNDQGILFNSFLNQAKSILIIWFLGLTIIGLPFILGWVFFRGFSLGFTIGFLVQEKAGAGVLISILSILPQNIVYIPVFIIWAVAALNFSLFIARGRAPGITNLSRALIAYSFFMLFFLGLALMGAFIEAYLSPWFLSLFL
jgi:stage II sporulation protein M